MRLVALCWSLLCGACRGGRIALFPARLAIYSGKIHSSIQCVGVTVGIVAYTYVVGVTPGTIPMLKRDVLVLIDYSLVVPPTAN